MPKVIFQILILAAVYSVVKILQVLFGFIPFTQEFVSSIANVDSSDTIELIISLFETAFIFPVVLIYIRYIEKRSFTGVGYSKKNVFKNYLVGLVVGASILLIVALALYVFGNIKFSLNENINWIVIFLLFVGFLLQGMGEELM